MQQDHFEEQAVRQLLNAFAEAVQQQDQAALDRMLTDDYAFVTPGGVVINKAQRLRAITAPDTRFTFVNKAEQELRLYDGTAVELAHMVIQGQILGQAVDQHARSLTVLTKQAAGWQMVAQQFNVIP